MLPVPYHSLTPRQRVQIDRVLAFLDANQVHRQKYVKVEKDGPSAGMFWIYPVDGQGHICGGPVMKDSSEIVINRMVERLNSGDLVIF